jgi:tyrosine-protein phosphatase YwqE
MFSFFSKKVFLVDLLEGLVDIHNHLLPGIDDGAPDVETSIELIKGMQSYGVQSFVATPHIMGDLYPNDPKTINAALNQLKKGLEEAHMSDLKIEAAAEHMIDDQFEQRLENQKTMPLKKQYMLIEMSYLQPSINFESAVEKVKSMGYFPIFAHPERYNYLHANFNKYDNYKANGLLFQMNMLSLGEYYGSKVKNTALKLIDEHMVDFLSSDLHNVRQLKALKNIQLSKKTAENLKPIINKTIGSFY